MAEIKEERVVVSPESATLLRVELVQVHSDGIDMGGALVLERSAAAWLAEQVASAADTYGFAEVDAEHGPDHFTVYVGGSDWQPFVHVHNQRAAAAELGGVYALGMTVDAARSLAEQLRR